MQDLKEGLLYTHFESIEDDGCDFRWTGESPAPAEPPQAETDSETKSHLGALKAVEQPNRANRRQRTYSNQRKADGHYVYLESLS